MAKSKPSQKDATQSTPWYADGLRFKCTGCGNCCTGAPGFVWVNKQEVENLAEFLGLNVEEFESRYVRAVGVRKSLVEYENGDCVFFNNRTRKCSVYEYRPRQCRSWPFWESNLRTKDAWAETCQVCPGSGQGPLYQISQIEAQKSQIRV